jgi:hypothetical protein
MVVDVEACDDDEDSTDGDFSGSKPVSPDSEGAGLGIVLVGPHLAFDAFAVTLVNVVVRAWSWYCMGRKFRVSVVYTLCKDQILVVVSERRFASGRACRGTTTTLALSEKGRMKSSSSCSKHNLSRAAVLSRSHRAVVG